MRQKKPQGPHRPSKPRVQANPARVPMSRSHGQQLRKAGSEPSFQTKVKRQAYWANRLAEEEMYTQDTWAAELANLGHIELKDETQFSSAKITPAPLTPADPNVAPGAVQIPGIDPNTGAVPPPPPAP